MCSLIDKDDKSITVHRSYFQEVIEDLKKCTNLEKLFEDVEKRITEQKDNNKKFLTMRAIKNL
jgi:hypothetical protein